MEKVYQGGGLYGEATILYLEAIIRDPEFLDDPDGGDGSVCIAYFDRSGLHYRQLSTSGQTLYAIDEPHDKRKLFGYKLRREFGWDVFGGAA